MNCIGNLVDSPDRKSVVSRSFTSVERLVGFLQLTSWLHRLLEIRRLRPSEGALHFAQCFYAQNVQLPVST